jgi:hypothetical protein
LTSIYEGVLDRAEGTPDLLVRVEGLALQVEREPIYSEVRRRAPVIRSRVTQGAELVRHSLIALAQSPSNDWEFWAGELGSESGDWAPELVVKALSQMLRLLPTATEEARQIGQKIATQFGSVGNHFDDEEVNELVNELDSILAQNTWWIDSESLSIQVGVHDFGLALTRLEQLREPINQALRADVERGFPSPPNVWREEAASGISILGSKLPADPRQDLLDRLQGDPSLEALAARISLLARLGPKGVSAEREFDENQIELLAGADSPLAQTALADWITLMPSATELARAISHLRSRRPRQVLQATQDWSVNQSVAERTIAVQHLSGQVFSDRWISAISEQELDDDAVIPPLFEEIKSASRAGKRRLMVRRLLALAPKTPRGQRTVADIIEWLLESPPKVNFEIAQIPIEALGDNHRSGERLSKAFEDAADRHDETISRPVAARLEAVGIRLHKRAVSKSAWTKLKELRKRVGGG